MTRIPTISFKITRERKRIYGTVKSRRKKIIERYKPFSPDDPSRSPLPELYDLYFYTPKDVLYYHATRLCHKLPFDSVAGNIGIGLISGIAAGGILSGVIQPIIDTLSAQPLVRLIQLLIYAIGILIISCYCVWVAHFISHLFIPDFLREREIEIIGEILGLEQYFSIQAQVTAIPSEEAEPAGTSRPC